MSLCTTAPSWFSVTGPRPHVRPTTQAELNSLSQVAQTSCVTGGDAHACAKAVYDYAVANQARASSTVAASIPVRSTLNDLAVPIVSVGPISPDQFHTVARISSSQMLGRERFYETPVGLFNQNSGCINVGAMSANL